MSSDSQMGWDAILSSYISRLFRGVISYVSWEWGGGGGMSGKEGIRKRGPAVILHFMTRSVADRIRPPLWLVSV